MSALRDTTYKVLYKLVPFPSPTLLVSRIKGETGLGEVKVSAVCGPAASGGWRPGLAEEPTRQQVLRAAEAILDWLSEVQP